MSEPIEMPAVTHEFKLGPATDSVRTPTIKPFITVNELCEQEKRNPASVIKWYSEHNPDAIGLVPSELLDWETESKVRFLSRMRSRRHREGSELYGPKGEAVEATVADHDSPKLIPLDGRVCVRMSHVAQAAATLLGISDSEFITRLIDAEVSRIQGRMASRD